MTVIADVFTKLGLQTLGISMPLIAWSPIWAGINAGGYAVNISEQALLTLNITEQQPSTLPARWVALMAGMVREIDTASTNPNLQLGVRLIKADGTLESGTGVLHTLFPQLYVRLQRLYATALEVNLFQSPPTATRGIPVRPVPRYFFYTTPDMSVNAGAKLNGNVNPGDELGRFNDLRIYDGEGMPIDPLAVFSCLSILLHYFPTLMWLPSLNFQPTAQNGLTNIPFSIATSNGVNPAVRLVRLCNPNGQPIDGSGYTGLGAGTPATGIYPLNAPQITSPANLTSILIGSPHQGTLGGAFTPPQWNDLRLQITGSLANPNLTMYRDFFTVRVIDMASFLLGTPDSDFTKVDNTTAQQQPAVRFNETLTLLVNGNEVLAEANAVLTPPRSGFIPDQSQCVAEDIDNTYVVPIGVGNAALWPQFRNTVNNGAVNPLPPNLPNLILQANYILDINNQITPDVLLTITGLPGNTAVRVYPRQFIEDAQEARGDGAGAVINFNQNLATFFLLDPFSFRNADGTVTSPTDGALLSFDLMVVSNVLDADGLPFSQLYGNLNTSLTLNNPIARPVVPPVPTTYFLDLPVTDPDTSNTFNIFKGTCLAEISGLKAPAPTNAMNFLQTLAGLETGNTGAASREAPRLPTMACRDLIVSNRNAAVISGGRLVGNALSGQTRLGAPGSPGGQEIQQVGVAVQGGRLADDLARLALRRTQYMPLAMLNLFGNIWDLPAAGNGSFVGAVLQNTPPLVEMPCFYFLKAEMADYIKQKATWNDPATKLDNLFNWLNTKLTNFDSNLTIANQNLPITKPIRDALQNNQTNINNAASALSDDTLANTRKDRIFQELDRRLITAVYGRRDTEWSLRAAIGRAHRFIYIETIGLASTHLDSSGKPTNKDLISQIASRIQEVPELKVILCLPKFPSFPKNFPSFIDYELKDRANRLQSLAKNNVQVFHPIGFPGRPIQLNTTLVVIDDNWALVGSSSLRRRGLKFDSSSDLVLTDTVYENGFCPSIARFRRSVMANRLGIVPTENNIPHPNFVRLYNGVDAFDVVSELLVNGGAGRIEPLYKTTDIQTITDVQTRQANPDGELVVQDLGVGNTLWAELWSISGLLS